MNGRWIPGGIDGQFEGWMDGVMHRKQKYRPKDSAIDVEKQGFFWMNYAFG